MNLGKFEIKYHIVPVRYTGKDGTGQERFNLCGDDGVPVTKYPFLSRRNASKYMFMLERNERKMGK